MNNTVIGHGAIVLFFMAFYGSVGAECGSTDNASSACRYPAGDAWCTRHGGGNLYAYKDNCVAEKSSAGTNLATRPPAPAKSWSPVVGKDCAKANTAVEHLICVNPDVRAQDDRMGVLYAALQARGQVPERTQRAWLSERNACDTTDCLRAVYAERIRYLETLAIAEAAAPVSDAPEVGSPGADDDMVRPSSRLSMDETPTTDASAPLPAPTRTTVLPDTQIGIPRLPLPEAPTLTAAHQPTGASADIAPPAVHASAKRGIVLLGAVLLIIGCGGLFAWRNRWRLGKSSRRRLAVFAQWMRTAAGRRLDGWRRPHRPTPARVDPSAGAFEAAPVTAPVGVPLSDDIMARLSALARPGESLSSVVARAVAALEVTAEPPPTDTVLSRLAALESRIAHVEGVEQAVMLVANSPTH
ncbi:MAG: lysozyme inhibitor LprI family protein [Azonexus sp.]